MEVVKSIASLFGSAVDELKRRVTSPLAGTFLFSWVVVNWDFAYYFLFSDENVDTKISHIDKFFLSPTDTIVWPLGLTVVYIILYPLVSSLSDAIWIFMERFGKHVASLFLEKYSVISKEEQESLYHLMRTKEEEYKSKIDELKKANNALLKSVNTLSIQVDDKETEETNVEHNDAQTLDSEAYSTIDMLNKIVHFKNGIDSVDGDYFLVDFIAKELVLDKDDAYDKSEIALLKSILRSVLETSPDIWYVKPIEEIRGNKAIQNSREQVLSKTKKLVRLGYLSSVIENNDNKYGVTVKPELVQSLINHKL